MVNDNAYKADLPDEYNVLATFNVKDLSLYLEDVDDSDLRTNHFQTEGIYIMILTWKGMILICMGIQMVQ